MNQTLSKIKWLMWKNIKVAQRNKCSSLFQFISPLIVCLMVLGMQLLTDSVCQFNQVDPPIMPVQSQLSRCKQPNNCTTIGYGLIGGPNEWTDYTIDKLKTINNFDQDNDIVLQFQGVDLQKYNDYFIDHKNQTDLALLFCTHPIFCNQILKNKLELQGDLYAYSVIYNLSNIPKNSLIDTQKGQPKADRATTLKVQVDDILANYLGQKKNSSQIFSRQISVTQQEYPKVTSRIVKGYDVMSAQGSFYFIIPPIFTFLFFTNEMLKEKELKLRQYMQVVGVQTYVYWCSWVLTISIVCLAQALIMTISGVIFQFKFFLDTPFLLLVLLFFTFSFSMQFVAIFIVVVCATQKQGNSVAYGFLLMSWVIQILLANVLLIYGLYQDVLPSWVYFVRGILTCYPPFNFSKVWGDINQYSGTHWSLTQNRWVVGEGYQWSYILNNVSGKYGPKHTFSTPSTGANLLYMLMDLFIFFAFSLYFDQVLSHNRGNARPWYFIFDIRWMFTKNKQVASIEGMEGMEERKEESLLTKSTVAEDGIVIQEVMKTFGGGGCWGKKTMKALQGVQLNIHSGELLTLLGHNGAGKTTLIQIMTGILQANSGQIKICGLDVNSQLEKIRSIIGVCPQFDILWNELTAGEHLQLYDHLKANLGGTASSRDKYLGILKGVGLEDVIDRCVGTFSGGMKRRLSMTIAGMNSPKVVFLDEPTTGMDPVSRRAIWDMVLELKKERVVLLTTHSMEEADVLSDEVAIMVDGLIKCQGTALELKNKYGQGYRLSIMAVAGKEQTLNDYLMNKVIPSAILIDRSASQFIYGIDHAHLDQLKLFVSLIEEDRQTGFGESIVEWALSNSTLEEVFMKVTNKKGHHPIQ